MTAEAARSERLPTYFLSHGGGPWPWMQTGGRYTALEASLRAIPEELGGRARSILMVSAHWEEPAWTVAGSARPPMIYDYYGFPPETYQIQYPTAGDPALAERVQHLLKAAGLSSRVDPTRGIDHGAYSVMYPMFPQADMPMAQFSLRADLDPLAHLAVGRALAPLRDEGVVIVGSGLSYHNLRQFGPAGGPASRQFDDWLDQSLRLPAEERARRLTSWEQAPAARAAHPREEHLLPLMVAVGAAGDDAAERIYHEDFMGALRVSSFRFGPAPVTR